MANADTSRKSLAEVLGALGPGGTISIDFDDYKHAYGSAPDEPNFEGHETIADLAAKSNCVHEVDHEKRKLHFWRR